MDDLAENPTPHNGGGSSDRDRDTWSDHDKWTAVDPDDDLDVFVVSADQDDEHDAAPVAEDLPATVSADDVAGDDWNDESWLASLDDVAVDTVASAPAPRPAPPSGGDTRHPPQPGSAPTGGGFVDASVLPTQPMDGGERLDEAMRTIAEASQGDATGRRVADADTAALLRELSMLTGSD